MKLDWSHPILVAAASAVFTLVASLAATGLVPVLAPSAKLSYDSSFNSPQAAEALVQATVWVWNSGRATVHDVNGSVQFPVDVQEVRFFGPAGVLGDEDRQARTYEFVLRYLNPGDEVRIVFMVDKVGWNKGPEVSVRSEGVTARRVSVYDDPGLPDGVLVAGVAALTLAVGGAGYLVARRVRSRAGPR